MIRYDLSALAKRRNGTFQPLPAIHGSVGAEVAYLRALRAMLREMAAYTRSDIVPAAVAEIAMKREMQIDADRSWFIRLSELMLRLVLTAETTIANIMVLESRRHTSSFMASAKRALGVDLSAVVRQEDLGDYLRSAATRNAGLIKGLGEDVVSRVQRVVTTAVINGKPAAMLRQELTEQFNIADRRAKLIARDQIAKLTSDLNRERHQQAGVTEYRWLTSHDERVRPLHKSLDGKVYKYGQPTGAEGGLPPGQPIACRCVAQAIVQF